MAKKTTRPLSGPAQRKYFRDLFRAQDGVTRAAADRLVELCAAELALIRVRLPMVVRRAMPQPAGVVEAVASAVATTVTQSAHAFVEPSVPPNVRQDVDAKAAVPFDPHAFSLIVTFRKGGKDALLAKLDAVGGIERLRAIAQAQHVALDDGLSERDDVLAALVEGTERRIAHRQAAAS